MAINLSPGVYIEEIDLSTYVPSDSNAVAFFAGNFGEGYVDYPQMTTSKPEFIQRYGEPDDTNFNDWFQPYRFLTYANRIYINRAYEWTDVFNETPTLSDFSYKAAEYINSHLNTSNGTASFRVKKGNGKNLPPLSIGDWVTINNQTEIAQVIHINQFDSSQDYDFSVVVKYISTVPSSIDNEGEIFMQSLRFLNAETQGTILGDIDTTNMVPQNANATNEDMNVDYTTNPNEVNENRRNYSYSLVKNPDDFNFKKDNGELDDFITDTNSGESAVIKFISRSPSSGEEIEIAIANWFDFLRVNGEESKAIAFRDVEGGITNDVYLSSLFQYAPQEDELAIAIRKGGQIETFVVSLDKNGTDGNGIGNFIETVINENSRFVYCVVNDSQLEKGIASYLVCDRFGFDISGNPVSPGVATDTLKVRGGRHFKVSEGAIKEAYFSVEDKERYEIDVIIGNEYVDSYGDNLNIAIDLAESRKDCLAYVGARYKDVVGKRSGEAVNNMVEYITETDPVQRAGSVKLTRSMFGAFFGNYFRIEDPFNKKYRWVNVAGDMAGIRCYISAVKRPWWISAGMKRGIIRDVERMAISPSEPQRDELYKNSINPLVTFPDTGNIVYGNKTLIGYKTAFDQIHIRSLFNVLERAMAKAARSEVFEFIDDFTMNTVSSMFNSYLSDIKAGRGIEDYLVVCDNTNNTAETKAKETMVVDIYIKPVYGATYIKLNFINTGTRSIATIYGTGF